MRSKHEVSRVFFSVAERRSLGTPRSVLFIVTSLRSSFFVAHYVLSLFLTHLCNRIRIAFVPRLNSFNLRFQLAKAPKSAKLINFTITRRNKDSFRLSQSTKCSITSKACIFFCLFHRFKTGEIARSAFSMLTSDSLASL